MEELRPSTLSEVLGQEAVTRRLSAIADATRARRVVPPNLLFHGPSGVGKTTAARAFARATLGDDWENSYHQLDGSDDRSATFLRDRIVPKAWQAPSRNAVARIIFLDESEGLSPEAQVILRPALESGAGSTIFILACNDLGAVSAPIRSRCSLFEFPPVSDAAMRRIVERAAEKAGLALSTAEVATIAAEAGGIPREAIKRIVEAAATAPTSPSG